MSVAKYHHRIPRIYLKSWCFSGDTVWYYDKSSGKSEPRNIGNIMGINYFHSIKAGSIFTTEEALDKIFAPLDGYLVESVDDDGQIKELKTKMELNQYYYNFDNWIIKDSEGKILSRKARNVIFKQISNISDNVIEEKWGSQYENDWKTTIDEINQAIINIHEKKPVSLTSNAAETIMDYFIMFQWRSTQGYDMARKTFDEIMGIVPEIRDLQIENSVHKEDKTVADEMWHDFLLSTYHKFLNGDGVMQIEHKKYSENLTYIFLIDKQQRLITSDNPCFSFVNRDGFTEPILVALPGLIISLAKKDINEPNSYKIYEMKDDDVDYYNRIIYEHGEKIVSSVNIKDIMQDSWEK